MTDRDALLSRLRAANPVPASQELPEDLADARPPLGWLIEENPFMPASNSPRRLSPIPLVAAVLVVVALVTLPLLLGDDDAPVATLPSPTPTTIPTTSSTTNPTTSAGPAIVPATTAMYPLMDTGIAAISATEIWVPAASTEVIPGEPLRQGVAHWIDGRWTYYEFTGRTSRGPARVYRVAVAPDGVVWVATERGLFAFDGTTWSRQIDRDVADVVVAADGRVWIGGLQGRIGAEFWLAYLDDGRWVGWDPPMGYTFSEGTRLSPLPNGQVWICSHGGYWPFCGTYDASTLDALAVSQPYLVGDPESDPRGMSGALAFSAAPDGSIWAGGCLIWEAGHVDSAHAAVARFDGSEWVVVEMPPEARAIGLIRELQFTPSGVLWVEGSAGVASFDGVTWSVGDSAIRSIDVLPDGTVVYLTVRGEVGVIAAD